VITIIHSSLLLSAWLLFGSSLLRHRRHPSVGDRRESGGRNNTIWGAEKCLTLTVPRQCLLVFLVEVRSREGKALESEKCKGLGCGLRYGQRREVKQGLYDVRLKLILILPLEGLHYNETFIQYWKGYITAKC
jgi:hypothetical protein